MFLVAELHKVKRSICIGDFCCLEIEITYCLNHGTIKTWGWKCPNSALNWDHVTRAKGRALKDNCEVNPGCPCCLSMTCARLDFICLAYDYQIRVLWTQVRLYTHSNIAFIFRPLLSSCYLFHFWFNFFLFSAQIIWHDHNLQIVSTTLLKSRTPL